jgi:hypothetical protein
MKEIRKKSRSIIEFGDFQTPPELASQVCDLLIDCGVKPKTIIEPTCGKGNFLIAALEKFPTVKSAVALDINNDYLDDLKRSIKQLPQTKSKNKLRILNQDILHTDWNQSFSNIMEPVLVIGNPPWITNSRLGAMAGNNLPKKSNFQAQKGFDALTGKSNFDISESILIKACDWLQTKNAVLAMLCKTSTARKLLRYVWGNNLYIYDSAIYTIDANRHFEITADACLFVLKTGQPSNVKKCRVYNGLSQNNLVSTIGFVKGDLVADVIKYEKWSHLDGCSHIKWRSGVKHDCSSIMEFTRDYDCLKNGLGKIVNIEQDLLFPFFKGSDIANGNLDKPNRCVLITQHEIGEDTFAIKEQFPKTWNYLVKYADYLDRRKSSIYTGRPRFCLFGIGDYAFTPWKVCIPALYKKLRFSILPPCNGKPSMLDDTCYYIPCKTEDEAAVLSEMLNSKLAEEFFSSLVFWDSKRPVTTAILQRLDLAALAKELNMTHALQPYLEKTLLDFAAAT